MKRDLQLAVALGFALALGASAPVFAQAPNADIRQDQRDIHQDQRDIHQDQRGTIKRGQKRIFTRISRPKTRIYGVTTPLAPPRSRGTSIGM